MPSVERDRSAVALVDALLSGWAQTVNVNVSPGRIRSWRRAGLLPTPTQSSPRPAGAPPGRAGLVYTEDDLETARKSVIFLAGHARRGRPAGDLALLQFAAGLPVAHRVVVAALHERARAIRREVDVVLGQAPTTYAEQVRTDMVLSDSYERAEALASRAVSTQ